MILLDSLIFDAFPAFSYFISLGCYRCFVDDGHAAERGDFRRLIIAAPLYANAHSL